MKSNFLATAILICAAVFTSCNVNDDIEDGDQPQAVCFTASIDNQAVQDGAPQTKAEGTTWGNDVIGVFMVSNGGVTTVHESNIQFTTPGTGTFTAVAGSEIYYPMDGSAVDFIAYYPYEGGKAIGDAISVDVSGTQTAASQAGIDLLWGKADGAGGAGYTKTNTGPVALTFSHKLAKLVMNVKADPSVGGTLDGMTVSIAGMNTKNTLALATGALGAPGTPAAITPNKITTAAGFAASYDAIILPHNYAASAVMVTFTVGGETFTWTLTAADAAFNGGNEYTYAVTLTRTGVTVIGTITPWTPIDRGLVEAE